MLQVRSLFHEVQSQTSTVDTITVYTASATPTIAGDTVFCQGDTITLSSSASDLYQWSDGSGIIGNAQDLSVASPGTYSVTVTDAGTICPTTSEVFVVNESIVTQPAITAASNGNILITRIAIAFSGIAMAFQFLERMAIR